jgi:signal transduction histidine kinase
MWCEGGTVTLRHLLALAGALAIGLASLAIARSSPGGPFGGGSTTAALTLLATGWALVICGTAAWVRRPASRFGALLVAAGLAWFLVEFNDSAVGSPVFFTVGLLGYAACPALVAHAVLAYPGGRVVGRAERVGVSIAYGSTVLVLGLFAALAFDPAAQGCSQCPQNLLRLTNAPELVAGLDRLGLVLGLVWAPALAAVAVWRIVRSSSAARLLAAPVLLPAVAYLALVAGAYANSLHRGFLSDDSVDTQLWFGQAAALGAVALGVVLAWARGRRARTAVARLVIELGDAAAPGRLRDALARALGDPALELIYPLAPGRHVDAHGHPVHLPKADSRALTPLVRGGQPVAIVVHRRELVDDPALLQDVGAAAGLALDRERLQAETHAQLHQLQASRARTVEAGDRARRKLERDVHDGAQQRLVVLSLALRLLRAELDPDRDGHLDAAEADLSAALAELRELARGIYPAVLVDEGLTTAIEALAEAGSVPIAIHSLPDKRLAPAVEAAAYFLVAEIVKRGITEGVTVRASRSDERLQIEIESAGTLDDDVDLVHLEDRIGALDGELTVVPAPPGHTTVRAELPCAS